MVRIQVVTTGGGASNFVFSQTNLFSTPAAIATAAPRQAAPRVPDATPVAAPGLPVTLTESPPATARLVGALCRDTRGPSAGAGAGARAATFGQLIDHTLTIPPARVVPGADITCVFTNQVHSGLVGRFFQDDGAGGGTANDSIANGSEAGIAGVPVSLTDCASLVFRTARSDENGRFDLPMQPRAAAGKPLCIQAPAPPGRDSTGASVDLEPLRPGTPLTVAGTVYRFSRGAAGDRVELTSQQGGLGGGLVHFGSVTNSTFIAAGARSGRPGTQVIHPHVFTAGTAGRVSFSVPVTSATPPTPGWAERIFLDVGCTGTLQEAADRLFPPATRHALAAGERLCVVLQQTIPAQAPPGSRNTTRLRATLSFDHSPGGSATSHLLDDLTSVQD